MAVTHRELAELSEQGLVELHRAGHDEAFAGIVRRYQPGLLAHARRRLGSQQAAEDAVQEALLRAYRALPRFTGEYRLGNWLHRILRNVCTDETNRRRRHLALVDRITASEPACAHEAVPADHLALSHDGSDVVRALDELPESYRTAFVLRAVEELPYDEVALACGISEENARARVSRARNVLRRTTARFGAFASVLGVTLRRGNRGPGGSGVGVNAVNPAATASTAAANVAAGPSTAAIQLTTAIHEFGPAAGAAGRAIAVLASAAAVIVPAALSSGPSDDQHETTTEQTATEATVVDAPEVLDITLPADDAVTSTTLEPATSTTELVATTSTTPADLRTASVRLEQLTLRPDGNAWTVSGSILFETPEGAFLGELEPYSRFVLGPVNDWGLSNFDLTGFVTLADGRAATIRLSGTASGERDAVPTTTATTATTLPPTVTTSTVPGDRPDSDDPNAWMVTTTTAPPVVDVPRPARYGPSPTGTFNLNGTFILDGSEVEGLVADGSVSGVLELDADGGTLQVTVTEAS